MRRLLWTGVILAVLQQWSGINVVFNYAEEIYRGAGYGVSETLFNIVITGSINLAFTLAAFGIVDRQGRRALMLAGCAAIACCHTLLGLSYALGLKGLPVLLCTLGAIGSFAISLGPVTWVLISEIFPNRVRGAAVSIAVSALWLACFALTFTFPILNRALGPAGTFWLYAGDLYRRLLLRAAASSRDEGQDVGADRAGIRLKRVTPETGCTRRTSLRSRPSTPAPRARSSTAPPQSTPRAS